jgi:hypothetical protein
MVQKYDIDLKNLSALQPANKNTFDNNENSKRLGHNSPIHQVSPKGRFSINDPKKISMPSSPK